MNNTATKYITKQLGMNRVTYYKYVSAQFTFVCMIGCNQRMVMVMMMMMKVLIVVMMTTTKKCQLLRMVGDAPHQATLCMRTPLESEAMKETFLACCQPGLIQQQLVYGSDRMFVVYLRWQCQNILHVWHVYYNHVHKYLASASTHTHTRLHTSSSYSLYSTLLQLHIFQKPTNTPLNYSGGLMYYQLLVATIYQYDNILMLRISQNAVYALLIAIYSPITTTATILHFSSSI